MSGVISRLCRRIALALSHEMHDKARRHANPLFQLGNKIRDTRQESNLDEDSGRSIEASVSKHKTEADNRGSNVAVVSDQKVNRQVGEELARQHGINVDGVDTPRVDTHTVFEIAAAMNDMFTKYPYSNIARARIADLPDGVYARYMDSAPWAGPRYGAEIIFSEKYARPSIADPGRTRKCSERPSYPGIRNATSVLLVRS